MIFIANKTREIEKNNSKLQLKIFDLNETIKVNKIELITHQNTSYISKLYELYFSENNKSSMPNIITLKKISNHNQDVNLVNIKK
tara:strand:- start:164 stop:418 length:255 start_codon:yes stop_codon:yes gene_type:complete